MEDLVNEKDVAQFFRKTGYNLGTYANSVVKSMLLDFANIQVKKHCAKTPVIKSVCRGDNFENGKYKKFGGECSKQNCDYWQTVL